MTSISTIVLATSMKPWSSFAHIFTRHARDDQLIAPVFHGTVEECTRDLTFEMIGGSTMHPTSISGHVPAELYLG
ncbi:MAG: hypothetical protein NVS2B16_36530 [Chloroflexota bacterium]